MSNLLTQDQRAFFDVEGYLTLEGFLLPDLCEALRLEVDGLMSRRARQEQPLIVSYRDLGMLTSHPAMMEPLEQLMGGQYAMHHIHATRHDAGQDGVNWHQDYEQDPHTNRSHLMVHVFYYLNGLNGEVGDLLLVPRSQHSVVSSDALALFGTEDLPHSLTIDRLAPRSAIIVHSALFHARRAKAGGERQPRYFIDISYCQNGVLWPGYRLVNDVNTTALEMGLDRDGRYAYLYDTSQFFDRTSHRQRMDAAEGSIALQMEQTVNLTGQHQVGGSVQR